MKKQLTVLLVFALLLTMAGCSTANAIQKLDVAEDVVEEKLDAAEDKLEESLRNAVSPAPAAAPTLPVTVSTEPAEVLQEPAAVSTEPAEVLPEPTQTPPAPAEKPRMLTEEEARKIALDYAGFTADQVTRLHSEYEIDDGIPQFDVEFYQGDWEYEFEIHAENGKILSYDKDHKYD